MIRKLSAHSIFTISGKPLKFGQVVCDSEGTIIQIIDTNGNFREEPFLEFYDGIIVPGFLSSQNEDDFMIFNRLKQQQTEEPDKTLDLFLREVTWNMAARLNCQQMCGSLEIKKRPGINLISGADFQNMKLTPKSSLRVLIPR